MSISDSDVVERGNETTLTIAQPSIFDIPNSVRIKYINRETNYQADDYILEDLDAIEAEGHREETISAHSIVEPVDAQRMALYYLERYRNNKTCNLVGGSKLYSLEPHDLVQVTHSVPGWTDKLFRTQTCNIASDGTIGVSLVEESTSFYDDDYDTIAHNPSDTDLLDPKDPPPSVNNLAYTEEQYTYRDRTYTRLKVTFNPPSPSVFPWWTAAEVWVNVGGAGWTYYTTVTNNFNLDPVEEGTTYAVKIVSVSIYRKQAFNDAISFTTTISGLDSNPSDLSGLDVLVNGDTVSIMAPEIADSDIDGYETRYGDTWAGGIMIAYTASPFVRIVGVRPGTYRFWMAAKDNGGRYSTNPVSKDCTVFYPANYTDKRTWTWDFTTGSFTNATSTTLDSTNAFKCEHTGNVLTGKWASPLYDFGSTMTVRVWGDFRMGFTSPAGVWDAVFPSTAEWTTASIASRTWAEIFNLSVAGSLQSTIMWGDDTNCTVGSAGYFELHGNEMTARYVKVDGTITDPALDSNLIVKALNMKAAYWA
jgi:hypothetical protein